MIIALKGLIGTGKSTLANEFAKNGYEVVSCDEIVHRLYDEDAELIEKINQEFDLGKKKKLFSLKREKATVDRKRLGEIVFSDQKKLEKLEQIVHPTLKNEMQTIIDNNNKVVIDCQVVDKLELKYDLVIMLQTDEETIINRIINRDNKDVELIRKIIKEQEKIKFVLKNRTYVIDATFGVKYIMDEVAKIKELKA